MHGEEIGFINEAFEKNWIAHLGFNCDSFEAEMDAYINAGGEKKYHSLCLNAGTAALHLAVKLAGVSRGDIVLCSDMTFAATVIPLPMRVPFPCSLIPRERPGIWIPQLLKRHSKNIPIILEKKYCS